MACEIGSGRPVERLAIAAGYEVFTGGDDLREGACYQVGARVLILVPGWARGARYRDALIARQLVLYALAAAGAGRFGEGLGVLRRRYAARLAGVPLGVPPPLDVGPAVDAAAD